MEQVIKKFAKKLSIIKANKINSHCKDYLGKTVLDVGSGRGYIAETIYNQNDVKVEIVDVIDKNKTSLKLTLYDGEKLPFKSNSFDTVLLIYVLHHCSKPIKVLKECLRVSKKNVIIFEDADPTLFTKIMDYSFNTIRGVKAPLKFKKINEWIRLFKKMNLNIQKIERGVEKEWFYPFVEHTMFVVNKK